MAGWRACRSARPELPGGTASLESEAPSTLRRHLRGVAELAVLAALVSLYLSTQTHVPAQDVWRGYLLFVCFLGAFLLVQALRYSGDPGPERSRGRRHSKLGAVPPELTQVVDALRAGTASRPEFDRGMRPLLREIATDRLLSLGVDPGRQPDRAAEVLGPRLDQMILSRGASLAGIRERGPSPAEVAQMLDQLEALAR